MAQAMASVIKGSSMRVAFLSLIFSGIGLMFLIIGAVIFAGLEPQDSLYLLTYPLSLESLAITGKVAQKTREVNGMESAK